MHPTLFKFGPLMLSSYGAMLILGFWACTRLAQRRARRLPPESRAITAEELIDVTSLSLLGGIVGGRLLYALLHGAWFLESPWELLKLWHGGLVWYGGFIGGLLAGWFYVRARRLDFLRVLDQCIPFLPLGHALGRIGCFLNGCCYGRPTEAWCGVLFPGHPGPVLPTQLFEAAGLCVLFLVLRLLQQPAMLRHRGRLFGLYLIGYAALRFGLEFLRGDQTVFWWGLTLQQIISVGMIVIGGILVARSESKGSR